MYTKSLNYANECNIEQIPVLSCTNNAQYSCMRHLNKTHSKVHMKYLWDKLCQHGSTLHNDFPKILSTDSRCKRLECARLAQKTIVIAHVIKLHQCTNLDVYCSDSNFTALQFYCLKILYNFWTPYPKFNMSFGQFLRALAKKSLKIQSLCLFTLSYAEIANAGPK